MGQQCCAVEDDSKGTKKAPAPKSNKRRESAENNRESSISNREFESAKAEKRRKILEQQQEQTAANNTQYAPSSTPTAESPTAVPAAVPPAVNLQDNLVEEEHRSAGASEDPHRGSMMSSNASTNAPPPLSRVNTFTPSQMSQERPANQQSDNTFLHPVVGGTAEVRRNHQDLPEFSPKNLNEEESIEDTILGIEDVMEPTVAEFTTSTEAVSQKASKYATTQPATSGGPQTTTMSVPALLPTTQVPETTRNRKFQFASTNLFPQEEFNSEDAPGSTFQFAPTNLFQQRIGAVSSWNSGNRFGKMNQNDSSDTDSSKEEENNGKKEVDDEEDDVLKIQEVDDDDDDIILLNGNESDDISAVHQSPQQSDWKKSPRETNNEQDYSGATQQQQQPDDDIKEEDILSDNEETKGAALRARPILSPSENHSNSISLLIEDGGEGNDEDGDDTMGDGASTYPLPPSTKTATNGEATKFTPEGLLVDDSKLQQPIGGAEDDDDDETALYGPQPLLNGVLAEAVLKQSWFRHQKVDPPRVLWKQTENTIHIRIEPANASSGWELINILDELDASQPLDKYKQIKEKLDRVSAVGEGTVVGRILEFSCEDQGIAVRAILPLLEPIQKCNFTLITDVTQDNGIHGGPPHLEITCEKVPVQYLKALSTTVDSDEDSGSDIESDSGKKLAFNKWAQLLDVHQRTYMKLHWIKEVVNDVDAAPANEYVYQGIYREGFQDTALFAGDMDDDDDGFSDDG